MSKYADHLLSAKAAKGYDEDFKIIFPDIKIDFSDIYVWKPWLPNYIMVYIGKIFNDNVYQLFDYKNILENVEIIRKYPYDYEDMFRYSKEEWENPNPSKYYPEVEERVEYIFGQYKDYIFDWVNKHEKDIKANITPEKIKGEIMNIHFSKDKLFNYSNFAYRF